MHEHDRTVRGVAQAAANGAWRAAVVLLAVIAAVTWGASGPALVRGETIRVGMVAPELAGGPWIGGPSATLASLRGRVVLLEFWTYG